jgi:Late embryogenesis abundant protein
MRARALLAAWLCFALTACAGLDQFRGLLQAPRFQQTPGRPAEIRLNGLSGAAIRLWTDVTNPNPFGLRLGTVRGTLYLEDSRAADGDFPLGLALDAGSTSTVPIDISVNFSDLPGLGGVARRVFARQPVTYRLDGTVGVDAGRLGQPVFGPMTLLRGEAHLQ